MQKRLMFALSSRLTLDSCYPFTSFLNEMELFGSQINNELTLSVYACITINLINQDD